jgi:hypothetical protein
MEPSPFFETFYNNSSNSVVIDGRGEIPLGPKLKNGGCKKAPPNFGPQGKSHGFFILGPGAKAPEFLYR